MKNALLFLLSLLFFHACGNVSEVYRHSDVALGDGVASDKQIRYVASWVKNIKESAAEHPKDSTMDIEGHFYTTGGIYDNNIGDIFISKYDDNGTKLWTKTYDYANSQEGNAITVDSSGNIYIAGMSNTSHTGENPDIIVLKVDANGTELWHKIYGTDKADNASDIALDTANNVYVCGDTRGDLDGEKAIRWGDGFLTKFSSDGAQMWTRIFGTSYSDYAENVFVDENNAIFVGGSTSGVGDMYLTKYNADGTKAWLKTYETYNFDYAMHMSFSKDKHFYMTGKTSLRDKNKEYITPNKDEVFARKIDKDGKEIYYITHGTAAQDEIGHAIIGDAYGNAYLFGTTKGYFDNSDISESAHPFLTQLSPSGKVLSNKSYDGFIFNHADIHLTKENNLFVIGGGKVILDENNTYNNTYSGTFFLKLKGYEE